MKKSPLRRDRSGLDQDGNAGNQESVLAVFRGGGFGSRGFGNGRFLNLGGSGVIGGRRFGGWRGFLRGSLGGNGGRWLAILAIAAILAILRRPGFALGLLLLLLLGWGGGAADAEFLLHEDFGEAETAAGQIAGFVVGEKLDAFFSDFSEEDLPRFLAEVINGKEGAVLGFAAGLFGLAAALVFLAAEAFLFPALLLGVAAGLLGLAALLGRELLGLGVARGALVLPGRAGVPRGAHAVTGEGLAGQGDILRHLGGGCGRAFVFCRRSRGGGFRGSSGSGGGSFLTAGQRRFGDVLHDFGRKMP